MSRSSKQPSLRSQLIYQRREELNRQQLEIAQALQAKAEDTSDPQLRKELARSSQQTISRFEATPTELMGRTPEYALAFFEAYGFSRDEAEDLLSLLVREWLDERHAQARAWLAAIGIKSPSPEEISAASAVPVYPAGSGEGWRATQPVDLVSFSTGTRRLMGIQVQDDAMAPFLKSGDTAFIDLDLLDPEIGGAFGVFSASEGLQVRLFAGLSPRGTIVTSVRQPREGEENISEMPEGSRLLGKVVKRLADA